jgi:CheY-specific phosphatase CheX
MTVPLKAEVVNAFIDPVVNVIKSCIGLDATLGNLKITQQIDPPPDLSVTIEMSGMLSGPVTWVFSPDLSRVVAQRMLSTDPSAVVPAQDCNDAIAELANIVLGNATEKLSDAGYEVDIHPPRMRGDGELILAERTLAVTLNTSAGRIRVFIGVKSDPGAR